MHCPLLWPEVGGQELNPAMNEMSPHTPMRNFMRLWITVGGNFCGSRVLVPQKILLATPAGPDRFAAGRGGWERLMRRWLACWLVLTCFQSVLSGQILPPGATAQLLTGGYRFTESPLFDHAGGVYFSDLDSTHVQSRL